MTSAPEPADGPQIGQVSDGQILLAVGLEFTFTEAQDGHRAEFAELDQWLTGVRLYSLEDEFGTDGVFWDELEDCGYAIGEAEVEEDGKRLRLYDVWAEADDAEGPLKALRVKLATLRQRAVELLPPGLRHTVDSHESPVETLKLIAQLGE